MKEAKNKCPCTWRIARPCSDKHNHVRNCGSRTRAKHYMPVVPLHTYLLHRYSLPPCPYPRTSPATECNDRPCDGGLQGWTFASHRYTLFARRLRACWPSRAPSLLHLQPSISPSYPGALLVVVACSWIEICAQGIHVNKRRARGRKNESMGLWRGSTSA